MTPQGTTQRPNPIAIPRTWTKLSSHGFNSDWEPTWETYFDKSRNLRLRWNSRNHRKGIPARVETESEDEERKDGSDGGSGGGGEGTGQETKWKINRRKYRWIGSDVWDISWWIAIIFTVGSVFWCINAILFFVYFDRTSLAYTNTESATAFLGGTTFVIGAYLGWVESLNPARDADFGWEVDEVKKILFEPRHGGQGNCLGRRRHHFGKHHLASSTKISATDEQKQVANRQNELQHEREEGSKSHLAAAQPLDTPLGVDKSSKIRDSSSERTLSRPPPPTDSAKKDATRTPEEPEDPTGEPPTMPNAAPWKWYGRAHSLAYVANTIQLFGASVFTISVLCGLPGVLPLSGSTGGPEQSRASEGLWITLYWALQVIGAPCFVIAGAMFALETQRKWWLPNVMNIGWQVGFWNMIGGFGFWFSGIFGIWRQSSISDPNLYQYWGTAFSTFWGSWAFLIGSYIQLWEGINKIP